MKKKKVNSKYQKTSNKITISKNSLVNRNGKKAGLPCQTHFSLLGISFFSLNNKIFPLLYSLFSFI